MLVIGAGLLTRSLANLNDFYPGFNRDNVLLFSVNPTVIGYKDVVPLYEQMLSRIAGDSRRSHLCLSRCMSR